MRICLQIGKDKMSGALGLSNLTQNFFFSDSAYGVRLCKFKTSSLFSNLMMQPSHPFCGTGLTYLVYVEDDENESNNSQLSYFSVYYYYFINCYPTKSWFGITTLSLRFR